jgi:hypothetical protein
MERCRFNIGGSTADLTTRHSHKIIDDKFEFIEGWESEEEIVGDPFNMLRGQRNGRLSATDWRASSDLTLTTEWANYRQELRDLPANSTPVNENGILTGVDWPEEPEEIINSINSINS